MAVSLQVFTIFKCVPQRKILGALIFLNYINDLPNCLSFSVPRMYVDDTHITYAGSDLHLIQSKLSHALAKLSKWLVSNGLDNVPIEQVSSFLCEITWRLEYISMKI